MTEVDNQSPSDDLSSSKSSKLEIYETDPKDSESTGNINPTDDDNNNDVLVLQQKLSFYEQHMIILIARYEDVFNKFNLFREFYLGQKNKKSQDVEAVLQQIGQLSTPDESQISKLVHDNAQLQSDFHKSCEVLKQQQKLIEKLKSENQEYKETIQMYLSQMDQFQNSNFNVDIEVLNQQIESLKKENQDLQDMYEMVSQESTELNDKNQTLLQQTERYASNEKKLRKENETLSQKVQDLEDELASKNHQNQPKTEKPKLDLAHEAVFTNIPENDPNEIEVDPPVAKYGTEEKYRIAELEALVSHLESELEKTADSYNKSIEKNETLMQDHKKKWMDLKNANSVIEQYRKIEQILRNQLSSANIEIEQYEIPVYDENE
ncbi:hypothetical protein TRFO_20879 [Tritrichomonas foetus]|uniref:Uncharacterized protein n=1 Tax=Tritrichomonas foetus TaxID=1144522 RepID=A0A1J4KFR0_9EUKA|nr:hypothetical protein TRFO_20879 [Tritrichomonas foetus]|eukprot:OHT10059.1 hypothetical protein TRFO_20879 [Tritrichomonas foetus]